MNNYISLANNFTNDTLSLHTAIASAIDYLNFQTHVKQKNLLSLKKTLSSHEKIEFYSPEEDSTSVQQTHRIYKHLAKQLHPDKCTNLNRSSKFKNLRKDADIIELLYFSHQMEIVIDLSDSEYKEALERLQAIHDEIKKNMNDPLFKWDTLTDEEQLLLVDSLRI